MVVARAAGTVMASSLNQNKFWTKYCCDGGIKPAPSPLGRWRKNDTIIRCLDGIFIEIFCVWENGLDPFPHLEFRARGRSATITGNNNRIIVWGADFGTCPPPALPVGTIDYQGAKGGRWGVIRGVGPDCTPGLPLMH